MFSIRLIVNFSKLLVVGLFISALSACVSRPSLESEAIIQLNNNLAQLQQWKLKGKIAWITNSERKSAYMNWQQNNKDMQFDLSNLVGINLASLSYNGELATLSSDGQVYEDSSPSALIYKTTGWNVPLETLSSWVKGAVSEQGRQANASSNSVRNDNQTVIRYENGLIKQIKSNCEVCDQWTINYTSYENVTLANIEYQLPKQISMYNPAYQATIKIKISQWSQ